MPKSKRAGAVIYENNHLARLFECHLFIVSVSDTRTGLIEEYRAAKTSLKSPFLVAMVVTAIRERLAELEGLQPHFRTEEI